MVAAWIRADTGVGPSIASGSQVCSSSCADLPMAPMNSSTQIVVINDQELSPQTWIWVLASSGALAKTSP